jgi:hypothetical protein
MKILFSVLSLACMGPSLSEAAPKHPNILILFADDQRADTIAVLGKPTIMELP